MNLHDCQEKPPRDEWTDWFERYALTGTTTTTTTFYDLLPRERTTAQTYQYFVHPRVWERMANTVQPLPRGMTVRLLEGEAE